MADSSAPDLKTVIEAILFAASRPLSEGDLREVLRGAAVEDDIAAGFADVDEDRIAEIVETLRSEYEGERRGFRIETFAAGVQMMSAPELAPWIRVLLDEGRPSRLSRPALETLAIVAYRQPVTRAEVEAIRGVNADGVISLLLERGLIRIVGRSEAPGRPFLYGTSQEFLDHFRLKSLDELPDSHQLRRTTEELVRRAAEREREQRESSDRTGGESPDEADSGSAEGAAPVPQAGEEPEDGE